eukprot:TRINITY_DN54520_c0_g1_i1.p1 TRINITY_DN54520_c0_g1~~TRINITY_DN54520_c0_g1_i1.p1  ORF type:complete len:259 (+),score=24.97 TRINITY_DN54520_c0_g1_i1:32-778(+)
MAASTRLRELLKQQQQDLSRVQPSPPPAVVVPVPPVPTPPSFTSPRRMVTPRFALAAAAAERYDYEGAQSQTPRKGPYESPRTYVPATNADGTTPIVATAPAPTVRLVPELVLKLQHCQPRTADGCVMVRLPGAAPLVVDRSKGTLQFGANVITLEPHYGPSGELSGNVLCLNGKTAFQAVTTADKMRAELRELCIGLLQPMGLILSESSLTDFLVALLCVDVPLPSHRDCAADLACKINAVLRGEKA